jgi:hypothetical protein
MSITTCRPTSKFAATQSPPLTAEWWETKYAEQFERPEPPPEQPFSFRRAAKRKLSNTIRFSSKTKAKKSPIAAAWESLIAIGELKKIWILLNDHTGTPQPKYDIEQQLVLDMVAAAFPKMQEFTGFSNLLPLDYLRNFHDLRLLRFSGYSKSSPKETLDILRSFKYLDSIIIYRYPEYYDKDHAIITSNLPQYLSLTPEVLSKVKALKRFEISHMTSRVTSEHVTVPMVKALRAHKDSLRKLSIHSDLPVTGRYVEELLSFLAVSNISRLSIQLIIPKNMATLLHSDAVFPKNTRDREMKFSDTHQSLAARELIGVLLRAS